MEMTFGARRRVIAAGEMPVAVQGPHERNREPSFIEVVNNRVYFYAEVTREKVLQLVKTLRQLNNTHAVQQREFGLAEPIPIYLYINSYGGEIFAGLSVMDEIISCTVPVITVIDGCCASAATLFSVVGQKRQIKPHAYMLIHQLASVCWGKHEEFLDEIQNQKRLMKMIKDVYKERTKIPAKQLEGMLKHDLWFDAKTCLRYGLVDEIL